MLPWLFSSKALHSPQQQPTRRSPALSLLHYETPSPPPSSRVDPKLKRRPRRPLRVWDYWKFGAIVAAKATEVTSDVLSHHIWGPRRKSWGIEMTIGTIRMLMSIGGLVPLPSDALVTPVTFRVKKRNLRGILAKFDEPKTAPTDWKASSKSDMATSKFAETSPLSSPGRPTPKKELVVLYIHGGAYYLSSAAAQRIMSIPLAKYTDSRIFALDYRLAPETCFPGPLHDAVSAYLRLVEDLHIPPENIIVCGDSAGGGLSLALLMYLRDNDYPLPSGAILMSPWVDLTMSCESWETNAAYDVVPFPSADNHMNPIALYLGEQTEEYLTHPYASPLFGDFKGLPPLLVQAGDAEVLRDEITLLAHKATLAGVQVAHELYEDAIHVFQAYPFLEASRRSFESMRNFVREVLPRHRSRSPQLLASIAERGLEKEIETDQTVVVSGDGVEVSTPFNKSEFWKEKKPLKKGGADNESSGEDSDPGPSWIPSPALPKFTPETMRYGSKDKGMVEVEHVENIDIDNIPDLHLSPPSPALGTTERPELRSLASSSSVLSASSLLANTINGLAGRQILPALQAPQPRRSSSLFLSQQTRAELSIHTFLSKSSPQSYPWLRYVECVHISFVRDVAIGAHPLAVVDDPCC
ncbi:hypothetical protein NLJ89_g2615 [Agrocybe chaxingu]|uniref:Alpha/beta hydrolase fold-3 domain-containing protein n=1 Tax=Agrocybe chaxingu TaxID=84603 RepID=A0A9W8MXI6_9AGAR|nr:hypothetical protein NLJ89_g2615 [Agrocybe chaxingu]